MECIVCFSGGHSSALVAVEAVRKYGKNNVILLNHDISNHVEHEDIKRFKEDVANYCDVPITYANAPDFENRPPLTVCIEKQAFGVSAGQCFCTYELKTKPFGDYLSKAFPASFEKPNKDVVILYGFDRHESDRITRRSQRLGVKGYQTDFPLAYWQRSIEKTEDIGIPRPSTYRVYKHANCTACLKAGRQHWYCVYCLRPDLWTETIKAEETIGNSIIKDVYLLELEPKFKEMREEKHICPTDKGDPAQFWAAVNNTLPEQMSLLPCECAI